MRVELIAYTVVNHEAMETAGYQPHLFGATDADELGEFAGRACYQSWGRPNPQTATNKGYLANILDKKHYSVLEHASMTFYITGVSRSFTHELVRHRHLSFSQVSQRYVDESKAEFVLPPDIETGSWESLEIAAHRSRSLRLYKDLVQVLTEKGKDRKEARQAARSVLPNATETKIVVTGNLRAWREFIQKRLSPQADKEIRAVAEEIFGYMMDYAPNTVQDLEEELYDSVRDML